MDLSRLTLLVTRPDPQGSALCQRIENLHGHAIFLPTITISPPNDKKAFEEALNTLSDQDWLIFNSPQAVYNSIVSIRKKWPTLPETVQFAAVGAGTAEALKHAGYNVAVFPETNWSTEGLLAMPVFQFVLNKKIVLIRGEGGRGLLEKALRARGAKITNVIAYQRALPSIPREEVLSLITRTRLDVIICTSFDGVNNLKTLVGINGWPYIKDIPLVVVSERIKVLAHDLGFQTIWVASNASHEAILNVIAQKRK